MAFPLAGNVPEPARGKLYMTSAAINVLDELIPLLPEQETGCFCI